MIIERDEYGHPVGQTTVQTTTIMTEHVVPVAQEVVEERQQFEAVQGPVEVEPVEQLKKQQEMEGRRVCWPKMAE